MSSFIASAKNFVFLAARSPFHAPTPASPPQAGFFRYTQEETNRATLYAFEFDSIRHEAVW